MATAGYCSQWYQMVAATKRASTMGVKEEMMRGTSNSDVNTGHLEGRLLIHSILLYGCFLLPNIQLQVSFSE